MNKTISFKGFYFSADLKVLILSHKILTWCPRQF